MIIGGGGPFESPDRELIRSSSAFLLIRAKSSASSLLTERSNILYKFSGTKYTELKLLLKLVGVRRVIKSDSAF